MTHQNFPWYEGTRGSSFITTLRLSQQAPVILNQQKSAANSSLRPSMLSQRDPGSFPELENLLFSCLQSADDVSALQCLDRLTHRFGSSNERVMALHGLYEEATAKDQATLEGCLRKYDTILTENPVNLPISKRRIALLRSLSRPADAVSSLVKLLEAVPTDAESWCELADLYQSQGMSQQAIFSLEEALLIVPNAWSVHARLGEVLYIYTSSADSESMGHNLERSIQHFCRSIELCGDYLRGLYGLALATAPPLAQKSSGAEHGKEYSTKGTRGQLHTFAKKSLENIITKQDSMEVHQRGYGENELLAVKELLGSLAGLS